MKRFLVTAALLLAPIGLAAQDAPDGSATPELSPWQTGHTLVLDGERIVYDAVVGSVILRDNGEHPTVRVNIHYVDGVPIVEDAIRRLVSTGPRRIERQARVGVVVERAGDDLRPHRVSGSPGPSRPPRHRSVPCAPLRRGAAREGSRAGVERRDPRAQGHRAGSRSAARARRARVARARRDGDPRGRRARSRARCARTTSGRPGAVVLIA